LTASSTFYDHPTSQPSPPVPASPAETHRQERLARMYDAPSKAVVPTPPSSAAPVVNAEEARRSAILYDSPDMEKVRERAALEASGPLLASPMTAAPAPSAPGVVQAASSTTSVQDRATAMGIDPAAADAALRELGLTQPEQQARALGLMESHGQAAERAWRGQVSEWGAAAERRYSSSDLAAARDLVRRYGDQDLVKAFNQYGIGNHPALVRFVVQMSRAIQSRRTGR